MKAQIQRIVSVAKMYYQEHLTQQEIAQQLNISRPLVSSMLSQAKELNIVEFTVRDPYSIDEELLKLIKLKFNIDFGLIIPRIGNEQFHTAAFVKHVANFLKGSIHDHSCVGLGWGDIIDQAAKEFPDCKDASAKCVLCPLIGNLNVSSGAFHTNELVRRFAQKSLSDVVFLNAPALTQSKHEQELFMNTDNYKQVLEVWKKLDTAVIAISSYPNAPDMASAYRLSSKYKTEKIVGEIISYYINDESEFVIGDNDFAIRIPLDILKKAKQRVLIVPPNVRPNTVRCALNTDMFNIVIMDENMANALIYDK